MKRILFIALALFGLAGCACADTIPDWVRHPASACASTEVVRYLTPGARASCGTVTFAELSSKPTTLAGYGITDAQARVTGTCSAGNAIRVVNADGTVTCQSAGAATWGGITGTLSAQTDLQSALDGKQPLDSDLTAIAALTTTSYGRGFLPLADASAGRTYLGLGSLATSSATLPITIAQTAHLWLDSYTSSTGVFTASRPACPDLSDSSTGCSATLATVATSGLYSDLSGTPTLPANTTATSHQFFTAYNSTTGAFTKAQPAASDVSGLATVATTGAYSDLSGTPTLYNQTIKQDGTSQTQRPTLNLISGTGATVSCADNSGATRTDCTIAASGTGTVTTTGSPASGNLAKFSGATSVTNGDISGDCTTSGALAITCTKTSGTPFAAVATSGSKTDVGLGNVTNDAQTKASIVPNTTPITAGKILVSNIIGTAYDPVSVSGSGATVTLDSSGVLTLSAIPNATLSNSSMTIAGHSVSLGGTQAIACSDISDSSIFCSASGANNAQTATYQVLAADFTNLKTITVASGTFTITLVASGSQPANGKYIHIINYGSGVVTLARSGQNINGGTTSLTIPAASATAPTGADVYSDGTNYFATILGAGGSSSPLTTKGDLYGHSTVDVRVGVGSNGQSLFADSTQTPGLGWVNSAMPLRYGLHDSDDLVYGLASAGQGGKISINSVSIGGNSAGGIVAGHPGVWTLTTGTSNGGDSRASMAFSSTASASTGMLAMGSGRFEAIIIFQIPTISTPSVRFLTVAGLSDLSTPASYTGNLIALVQSDNINSGAFVLDVVTAGTAVVTNGVTTPTAGDWYAERIAINSGYTQVDLYTRDLTTNAAEVHEATYTGTAGSTLPATSVGLGLVLDILNQNGSTSRSANLDGMEYTYLLSTPR